MVGMANQIGMCHCAWCSNTQCISACDCRPATSLKHEAGVISVKSRLFRHHYASTREVQGHAPLGNFVIVALKTHFLHSRPGFSGNLLHFPAKDAPPAIWRGRGEIWPLWHPAGYRPEPATGSRQHILFPSILKFRYIPMPLDWPGHKTETSEGCIQECPRMQTLPARTYLSQTAHPPWSCLQEDKGCNELQLTNRKGARDWLTKAPPSGSMQVFCWQVLPWQQICWKGQATS